MIRIPVQFTAREQVHIASPDWLMLPKIEVPLADGVKVDAGEFITPDGQKATLGTESKQVLLVTESSYYKDGNMTPKPSGGVEGYFGEMLVYTKVYDEGGTAFAKGDKVTVVDGKLVHVDTNHTVSVGEVVDRGNDWIAVALHI